MIEYLHRGDLVSEVDLPADLTLLDYLRLRRRNTSAKEGCASGDCGACTVALGRLGAEGLHYQSVNACICPAAELQGCELVTAADLADGADLHPVQQAFVDLHASQCGFCTPGFVISTFVLLENIAHPSEAQIQQAIAGNLCRCTGYGPIIEAVAKAAEGYERRHVQSVAAKLERIARSESRTGLALPTSLAALAQVLEESPGTELIAGGTDLMLEVTQNLKPKAQMIGLTRIAELNIILESDGSVEIGAGVSFTQMLEWASQRLKPLAELLLHIGSDQIRNRGTLGGNLGSASPIGDLAPVLLALKAEIRLWSPRGERTLALRDFFTGYRKTVLEDHEIIRSVSFRLPMADEHFTIDKVSKRKEDDISTLCQAVLARFEVGKLVQLSIGLGGMAATPLAAQALSDELVGRDATELTYAQLRPLVDRHLQPMDDLRASAQYRLHCCAALLAESLTAQEIVHAS